MRFRIGLPVLLLALLGSVRVATAYCVWSLTQYRLPSDAAVYVVTSGTYSVLNTGLSTATVVNYVRATMDAWNRSSGQTKVLYWGGEVSDKDAMSGNGNIVVYGASGPPNWPCGSGAACALSDGTHRYIAIHGPAYGMTWSVGLPVASGSNDLREALAHEFGHHFGLAHPEQCGTSTCLNTCSTTWGLMRQSLGNAGTRREPRMDDILGLRDVLLLGGGEIRSKRIRFRQSTDGQTWSADEYSLSDVWQNRTTTPLAATDAATSSNDFQAIAWVDKYNELRYLTGDWSGWFSNGIGQPVSTWNWATYYRPAVAQGGGKVFVAWLSGETQASANLTVRWAVRNQGGGSFTEYAGPTTNVPSIAVGYNNDRNVFIITYLQEQNIPHFLTVQPSGSQTWDQSITPRPHAVSDSACDSGTSGFCLTAQSTNGPSGPCLAWFMGSVSSNDYYIYSDQRDYCYTAHGVMGITFDNRSSYGYVGSFNQNAWYGWVYRLPAYNSVPTNLVYFDTGFSPIEVASQTSGSGTRFRAFYGRQ